MDSTQTLLAAANAVAAALSGVITALAWRAYRRCRRRGLRSLAAGFGLVTVGLLAGLGFRHLAAAETTSALVQGLFTAAGLGLLTFSLYRGYPTVEAEAN